MIRETYVVLKNKIKILREIEKELKEKLGYPNNYEHKLNEEALFDLVGNERNFKVDPAPILETQSYEEIVEYANQYLSKADELALKEIKEKVVHLLPYLSYEQQQKRNGRNYRLEDILKGDKVILHTWIDDWLGEKSISYSAMENLVALDKFLHIVLNNEKPNQARANFFIYQGTQKESEGAFEPHYIFDGLRVKIFKNGKLELKFFTNPKYAQKLAQSIIN